MAVGREGLIRENLKKLHNKYYSLKDKEVNYYDIPAMKYLVSNGIGQRNIYDMYDYKEVWTMGRFINRVKHYTIKELNRNFSRMPVEMEWLEELEVEYRYNALMPLPDYITEEIFNKTMADLNSRLGKIDFKLEVTNITPRRCAQLLHQGSYQEILITREKLLEQIANEGYSLSGNIHEIYLNHPNCNPPEKLKILLRQEIIQD